MMEAIASDFAGKHILSLQQFDQPTLQKLFDSTKQLKLQLTHKKPPHSLKGKIATLLFYEPSSRTMGSFDIAVKRLGGQTHVVIDPMHYSSVAKGETFEDTIRTFETYSDLIILRHPEKGMAEKAAAIATKPVINAGDGIGEHPTQALLDLYTIWEQAGRLDNLTGLIAGDIAHGRTVHSLLEGLSLYRGVTVFLLAPPSLQLTKSDLIRLARKGLAIRLIDSFEAVPYNCDFWYWTRIQKERLLGELRHKTMNQFVITPTLFDRYASQKTVLMHPLPRVGEIELAIDSDPRAIYLTKQIHNGLLVRMALLNLVLG